MTEILATVIPSVAAILAAVLGGGRRRNKKLDRIEILVDGRLSTALEEIHSLKKTLASERGAPPPPEVSAGGS